MLHAIPNKITGYATTMTNGIEISVRTWPIWLGVTGVALIVAVMAALLTSAILDASPTASHTVVQLPVQLGLRAAFLLITLGALQRLRSPVSKHWRWAIAAALVILGGGIAIDLLGAIASLGWVIDFRANLGPIDSLEQRLFRIGAMAAYAIPMLVLLAAGDQKEQLVVRNVRTNQTWVARIAALLLRWEPVLFTIGVATLSTVLIAAAFINREFTWLLPIGADTTVAACAAATIRAHNRSDSLAFAGWLLVCASMSVGLLLGGFSFGGPLPTPGFIGDYNELPRLLLRDGHVMLLSVGIISIAIAATRKQTGVA